MSIKDRITKPQQAKRQATELKGASGTGKTEQIGRLISAGYKVLYGSVERKASTIHHLNPDMFVLEKFDFPANAAQVGNTQSDLYEAIKFLRTPDHGYDIFAVDSGMRLFDEMSQFLKNEKRLTGYDLWGAFAEKGDAAIKKLVELTDGALWPAPVHVIVTWGVELGTDWKGKRSAIPIMDGKRLGPRLDYLFDNVLYLAKKEDATAGKVDYAIYTAGTEEFDAKVSSPVRLPAIITNPNLATILRAIEQGKWPPDEKPS